MTLPPSRHRPALPLSDHAVDQLAAQLGITPDQVREADRRARDQLREERRAVERRAAGLRRWWAR